MRIPPWRVLLSVFVLLASRAEATPGDLDATFGTGGVVSTTVGTTSSGRATVLQPDGKIVVAGVSNGFFLLLRYRPDGTLDADFGSGGIVTTPIGDSATAAALVRQADGKLVVAGTSTSSGQPSFALVRYDDDGTPDAGFGSAGIVTTPLPGAAAYALVQQADDKLVAAGTSNAGDGGEITLIRYTMNGSLDATFGTGGVVTTSLGSNPDVAYAVALQPDQQIVACGRNSSGQFALARYDTNGTLDATFGTGGVSGTSAFGASCHALALQSDGKIVGVGSGVMGGSFPSVIAAVVRVAGDGTLDPAFVTNQPLYYSSGVRIFASSFGQSYQVPRAVTVDSAGRTIFAGVYAVNMFPGVPHVVYSYSFYAARLNADGTGDATFPLRSWPAASGFGGASALLLHPDHKAVAVGTDSRVAVVRFLTGLCGDGVVDAGEACDDQNGVNGDGCDGNCTTTACGNGMVTPGESCDDGNVAGGDCCDAACAFEAAGTICPDDGNVCTTEVCNSTGRCTTPAVSGPCDDGDPCTSGDTCVFGACQPSSFSTCPMCESCAVDGSCIAAPLPACAPPSGSGLSRLTIKDKIPNKSDQVQWQWTKGTVTTTSFGDPLGSDAYALCVYDQSGVEPTVAFRALIPAGGQCGTAPCWRSNAKGFVYKNKARTPDGAQSLQLKSGAGNAKLRFQGNGDLLSGRPGGLPTLPLGVPLRVQLQSENGACWEATFGTPSRNEPGRFDAKSD